MPHRPRKPGRLSPPITTQLGTPPPLSLHVRHVIALNELTWFITHHFRTFREMETEENFDEGSWQPINAALDSLREATRELMLSMLGVYNESHDDAYRQAQAKVSKAVEYAPVEQLHQVILMMRVAEESQDRSSGGTAGA